MSNSKPTILYALECGHAAPGPATLVNGVLGCAWHQSLQKITDVIEYEWRAACRQCTFARWAGLSKHNAAVFAHGHGDRNHGHVIDVEYTRNPIAVRTRTKMRSWRISRVGQPHS